MLLLVTKAQLQQAFFKNHRRPRKKEEEIVVVKDISVDAAVVADLSELDVIFAIKEKPKMALLFFVDEIFVDLSDVLAFPLTDFGI